MKEVLKNLLPLMLLAGGAISCYVLIVMQEAPARQPQQPLAPVVELKPVERHTGDLKLEVDGVATPFREITLSAEIGGRITFKSESCRAGRFVAKGEKLLEIDPRDYKIELDRLGEELKQAQASVDELEVQIANSRDLLANSQEDLRLQRNDLERQQQLDSASATTRSQVEQAERAVITSQNRVIEQNNQIRLYEKQRTRLASTIELAQTKLERARLDLERTEIVAPVSGVVVEEFIEQDSLAQQGTKLVTIEDTSAVEVKCNLQTEELYWIWSQAKQFRPQDRYDLPPLPATVTYEAGGRQYQWQGELSRYDGIGFDQRTRMVPCRVVVEEPFQVSTEQPVSLSNATRQATVPALMRGMFVTVELAVQPTQDLLSIDQRAIQPTGEVIVVQVDPPSDTSQKSTTSEKEKRDQEDSQEEQPDQPTGTARMVQVKVLHYEGERAIVVATGDSPKAGDRVIVTPLPGASPFELREGTVKVRIADPPAEQGAES